MEIIHGKVVGLGLGNNDVGSVGSNSTVSGRGFGVMILLIIFALLHIAGGFGGGCSAGSGFTGNQIDVYLGLTGLITGIFFVPFLGFRTVGFRTDLDLCIKIHR